MKTYLVRARDSKRLVGIFSALGSDALFHIVDELADPFECEYLPLYPGEGIFLDGIFKTNFIADPFPGDASEYVSLEEAPVTEREPLHASQALTERLDSVEDFGWQAFTRDDAAALYFLAEVCCRAA